MEEIISRVFTVATLGVAAFIIGIICITSALGFISGISYGGFSVTTTSLRKRQQVLLYAIGGSLILFGIVFSIIIPATKPIIEEKSIFSGNNAKAVAVDGANIYLLLYGKGIFKIDNKELELIDEDTNTRQIEAAGGMLYILKANGNIWSYFPLSKRLNEKKREDFELIDTGTGTKQILAVGDSIYVLKESGNIWKYPDPSIQYPTKGNPFIMIDTGENTEQIASSGSILYILKTNGNIWQFIQTLANENRFDKVYEKNDAIKIAADGETIYFITKRGETWKYKEKEKLIEKNEVATDIRADGGFLYILTDNKEILRYDARKNKWRKISEAGKDNDKFMVHDKDIYVIKDNGSVWKYSELIGGR